jgi:NTP pyrophosphatase (non-canonical NTP hydrolase)
MNLIPVAAQEECAEVIQAISKVFRFTLNHPHPETGITNKCHLEEEIGQLQCMLNLLSAQWELDRTNIARAYDHKLMNYNKWDKEHGVLK